MTRRQGKKMVWKLNLDEELEEGNVYGYVTNAEMDVQLKNYLEKQEVSGAIGTIQNQYEMVAILTNMYIEEDYRGQGIGTMLMENFISKASSKGADAVILIADTGERNEFGLVEWYENYGFNVIYGDKHSFPLMLKEL